MPALHHAHLRHDVAVSDVIWPGQKVDGHDASVARVSRSAESWQATCSCGWTGSDGAKRAAEAERESHLRQAVDAGARIIGGGREAPTG